MLLEHMYLGGITQDSVRQILRMYLYSIYIHFSMISDYFIEIATYFFIVE